MYTFVIGSNDSQKDLCDLQQAQLVHYDQPVLRYKMDSWFDKPRLLYY